MKSQKEKITRQSIKDEAIYNKARPDNNKTITRKDHRQRQSRGKAMPTQNNFKTRTKH